MWRDGHAARRPDRADGHAARRPDRVTVMPNEGDAERRSPFALAAIIAVLR